MADRLRQLVEALRRADAFPHATGKFEIVETHISFILLTGEFAYKFKKPVNLGFLDFSTAARREHFCYQEVRLNRRLVPEIYLGVVEVTAGADGPEIAGQGAVIWHAVQMRQFDRNLELDRLVPAGELRRGHIDALAIDIGHFHQRCARSPPTSAFGSPDIVAQYVLECFEQTQRCVTGEHRKKRFTAIRHWVVDSLAKVSDTVLERKRKGFVREVHGDLHLHNMLLMGDRVVPFDCLEFNPELSWIDVISDIAFLLMDLDYHGHHELAAAFLSGYLECTGDYGGLCLLRLYQVYRAMVRTKVACIRELQELEAGETGTVEAREVTRHLNLAHAYLQTPRPRLLITCGLSGSGKTTLAASILGPLGAIRIRSDVERKRLAGWAAANEPGSGTIDDGIYAPEMTVKTYGRLLDIAKSVLGNGWSVIVDATFLRRAEREQFRKLAGELGAPFAILYCHADLPVLEARVALRTRRGTDASDATESVLRHQLGHSELPGAEEQDRVIEIRTDHATDLERIVAAIRAM